MSRGSEIKIQRKNPPPPSHLASSEVDYGTLCVADATEGLPQAIGNIRLKADNISIVALTGVEFEITFDLENCSDLLAHSGEFRECGGGGGCGVGVLHAGSIPYDSADVKPLARKNSKKKLPPHTIWHEGEY